MRTDWPANVAAEKNRIVADEEAFERLVDLFEQAHGRAPASDCEAYQWGAKMEDAALIAMGFGGRGQRLLRCCRMSVVDVLQKMSVFAMYQNPLIFSSP